MAGGVRGTTRLSRVATSSVRRRSSKRDLIQYTYPSDAALASSGVTGIFLGYFLAWDGWQNALMAETHGFARYGKTVEGSLVNYENLDNAQTGIHDYFKFLKFGFGRSTDLACMQVRRGRISRTDAIKMVKRHDGRFPWSYLGVSLEDVLGEIDMTVAEFQDVCDTFTNRRLFRRDADGSLIRQRDGSLIKINDDNDENDETTTIASES